VGRAFSISEYAAELDRLANLADAANTDPGAAGEALNDLRGDWNVQAGGQTFEVKTAWLGDQFEKLKNKPEPDVHAQLLARLRSMRADAEAFEQTPPDSAAARAALTRILARSEFHQVRGPSWWDRLKFRIEMWIYRMLSRFFGSSSAPVVGRIFVWTLVAGAVLVLAWFVYRTIKENARLESIMPEVVPVSAKLWRAWLDEARAAAAKGQWREAVHLAYWAGISFLEASGMWRPDQARTPREYLRLLPAGSEHRAALSTLTRTLEVTLYGNQPAGPETFAETVSHLENLGCRQG